MADSRWGWAKELRLAVWQLVTALGSELYRIPESHASPLLLTSLADGIDNHT
jgi:hypothetical protein